MISATALKTVPRRLLRAPLFTVVTIATLGLGIGANTAIFSVVRGVLLKSLPYPEPERLVGVWETALGLSIKELNACPATYFTFREESRVFEEIGIWRGDSVSVTGVGEPEHLTALDFTDGVLTALRVKPVLGRAFTLKDDTPGAPATVMLTYGYWQKRFGGAPGVIGQQLKVDGELREIIGVLPQGFQFMNRKPALILPLQLDRGKTFIGNFSYTGIARLKPGVTPAAANQDVARMLPMMQDKFPPAPGMSVKMFEEARLGPLVRPLEEDVIGGVAKVLWVLMGTVGIVLLIACANVANLLLVRAEGRQQELAIRAALGASWPRIAGELLTESMTLALLGGVVGVGLAYGALRLLVALSPGNLPRMEEISIDPAVLLFSLAVSILAGVLFGVLPVIKYAGRRVGMALRDGGRTASEGRERHRSRDTLVVVQVALALVLLISAGLMIRTMKALREVQPGFTKPEEIQVLRVSIPEAQVPKEDDVLRMHEAILRKMEAIPGAQSVALSNAITMEGWDDNDPVYAEGREYSEGQIPQIRRYKFLSPGAFKTMGNPLLAGRDFTWADLKERRNVVLVSENLARELWGGPSEAIGKRIRENPKGVWREVIGVAGNEHDDGVDRKAPAVVYWPMILNKFWDMPVRVQRTMAYAIRSSRAGSTSLVKEAGQAVWSVNPDLPLADVRTVEEIYGRSMARTAFTLVMLALAAGMALLLGVVGIYGVLSYSVSQRTREIGIRMALGARQEKIRQMFVGHGLRLAGIGVVCGAVAAAALTKLMRALLFEVSPMDPVTYGAVAVVLIAAAWVAAYLPARRATAIAPLEALRSE
jgi:putative ABC transport system permease protein